MSQGLWILWRIVILVVLTPSALHSTVLPLATARPRGLPQPADAVLARARSEPLAPDFPIVPCQTELKANVSSPWRPGLAVGQETGLRLDGRLSSPLTQ
jgi:hypothetical protein